MEQHTIKTNLPPLMATGGDVELRAIGNTVTFQRNSLIYSPGDSTDALYLISSGDVRLSRFSPDGRELTLDHYGEGEVFGEAGLLSGMPGEAQRECQAFALSDVSALRVDRHVLMGAIAGNPALGLWFMQLQDSRQTRMEKRMETLLFKSASGKVAQMLLDLADQYGLPDPEGILLDCLITHQEIGNFIATTRETVSYTFIDFREQGLITTRQRKTVIRDRDGLEAAACC